jgi:hypothetical protein
MTWLLDEVSVDGSGRVVIDETICSLMSAAITREWPNSSNGEMGVNMYNSLNLAWGTIQLFQAKFMHLVSPTINKCIPVQGVAGLVMAYAIRRESPFTTHMAKKKKEKEKQALQAKQDAVERLPKLN